MNQGGAVRTVRLTSLDVFRGAVMLLLIPNVHRGLAMPIMAERYPDNRVFGFLGGELFHAEWSGCTIWDLIMPAFLFVAGVSMVYSHAARVARGESFGEGLFHAVTRAATLMALGLAIQIQPPDRGLLSAYSIWPIVLLALGLPTGRWLQRLNRGWSEAAIERILDVVVVAVLVAYYMWLAANGTASDWVLHEMLPQLALVYVIVFLLIQCRPSTQWTVAIVILVGYWLAFVLWPVPVPPPDPASIGVSPNDEIFTGFFAHWNKGTNIAAAFDNWLFQLLPRASEYTYNPHGYSSLNFLPTTVVVLAGATTGTYLRASRGARDIWRPIALIGLGLVASAWLLGQTIVPIVRSIWTPSFTLLCTGWILLSFGVLHRSCAGKSPDGWLFPIIVVGLNPLTMYIVAWYYRYWIVRAWEKVVGPATLALPWWPILEAGLVGLTLWILAYVLYRLRIFVRV